MSCKNKVFSVLYYVLTFTWGIITNIIGLLIACCVLFIRPKVFCFNGRWVLQFGKYWGGLSMGNFIFVANTAEKCFAHTLRHETGHSLQNIIWGPLFLPVIGIPSAIRYWLFNFGSDYSKKAFTAGLFTAIIFLTSLMVFAPWLWLNIIGYLLIGYAAVLLLWLFMKEIPLQEPPSAVQYDDIWFEGQATRWGTKYVDAEEQTDAHV